MPSSSRRWTYSRAGVNRTKIAAALRALLAASYHRPRPGFGRPLPVPGHYAGLVRIGRETVAVTTDTVGTKVLLAHGPKDWESLGVDLVAINVNDLASVGARPFAFVDTISCVQPRNDWFRALGKGIGRGLAASGCALVGGETAVVPDLLRAVDLGGTALGYFPARRPVTGREIATGDSILGIPSSGLHSNGFTLVRKILGLRRPPLDRPRPGARKSLRRELLEPTRIYVDAVEAVVGLSELRAFAHISGGGVRNLVRLHRHRRYELSSWPAPQGIFDWLRGLGNLSLRELYQTFNMGIGFVVVTSPGVETEVLRRLRRAGYSGARVVGRVVRGSGVTLPHLGLEFDGYA